MDTSTQVSSVAVLARGQLAAEITMQARLTHCETLMPHVAQALAMAGVTGGARYLCGKGLKNVLVERV